VALPMAMEQPATEDDTAGAPAQTRWQQARGVWDRLEASLGVRPWAELTKVTRPRCSQLRPRLQQNLPLYKGNYAVLAIATSLLFCILSPQCIIAAAVLAVVWYFFLKRNSDPEWRTVVAGVELNARTRLLLLAFVSMVIFVIAVGPPLLIGVAVAAVAALAHASCLEAQEGSEEGLLATAPVV